MNGFDILDLVIGLIFIYLIYSIACTTIWEVLVNISSIRGKMLREWFLKVFNETLDSEGLGTKILDHPLLKALSKTDDKLPSYISSKLFTDVLLDLLVNESQKDSAYQVVDINSLNENLEKTSLLPDGIKRVFLHYISDSSGDIRQVKENIGQWYNDAQDRLIGSYKKKLQKWILLISILLVSATNADTINLANYLYSNDEARETLAIQASQFMQDTLISNKIKDLKAIYADSVLNDSIKKDTLTQNEIVAHIDQNFKDLKNLKEELEETDLPLGWNVESGKSYKLADYIKKFCGLLLTALAVSLGAPFWFDILNKLGSLRSSGNKPKIG